LRVSGPIGLAAAVTCAEDGSELAVSSCRVRDGTGTASVLVGIHNKPAIAAVTSDVMQV
jgi:hypothetical protein